MSQWTHVAGVLRLDAMRMIGPLKNEDDVRAMIGKTCQYDSPMEDWTACTVPCGSEGSIQYQVIELNPDNYTASWVVAIWGDLCDYSDVREIASWWKRISTSSDNELDLNLALFVRAGLILIEVEGRDPIFLGEGQGMDP